MKEKTVFFGPFLGELGWEVSYWHGWVKKMCREKYQSYRKIASSYPGREPFYPDVDEFWPHPPEITGLKISQRGYIADFWKEDFSKDNDKIEFDKNIRQYVEKLLNKYQKNLPPDTIFFVPHKLNAYQLNGRWYFFGNPNSKEHQPKALRINFKHQIFETLDPTDEGKKFLEQYVGPNKKIIAVFPRCRSVRRPDKNWPRGNYDILISNLKKRYPEYLIGIFGAPGGSYYIDGVPEDCIDFINLNEKIRFNVQLAALKYAELAIGGVSGALLLALLAGTPVVDWGYYGSRKSTHEQNFLKTRLVYWPEINPSVETIENLVDLMIQKREKEIIYPPISKGILGRTGKKLLMAIKDLARIILNEIARIIFLFYFRRKIKEGVIA